MLLHINTLAYVIKLTNDDENIAEDEEEILSSMYKTHTPPTSSNHQHYILTNFFFLRHLSSSSSSSSSSLLFFLFWYSWFERDVLSAMLDEWRRRKYLACARAFSWSLSNGCCGASRNFFSICLIWSNPKRTMGKKDIVCSDDCFRLEIMFEIWLNCLVNGNNRQKEIK